MKNEKQSEWPELSTGRDPAAKVRTLDELSSLIPRLKASTSTPEGRKVVQCHGVFDLIHPGHLRHLSVARSQGDILVVTITADRYVNKGPDRPVFNERLRAEWLASLETVDFVAINDSPTAVPAIQAIRPDIYAKGSEYAQRSDDITGKIYDEEEAVVSHGGRIFFTSDITFSSTRLLNSFFNVFSSEAESYLTEFRKAHRAEEVIQQLKGLKDTCCLVIGDTIIDEYHFCRVLGKASKSSAINAQFLFGEEYPGGSLAVANHVAGFCDQVQLVTCLGEADTRLDFVRKNLKRNISTQLFTRPDGPTTVKRRFTETHQHHKMFEVSFLEDRPLPQDVQGQLNDYLNRVIDKYDVVIVADFGHGLIGPETIELLANKAKFLAVNSQTNSANIGYNLITKYPRADYVCIDHEEVRLAYHEKVKPLDELMHRVQKQFDAETVTVTVGVNGSKTLRRGGEVIDTPVFSREVVDATGAGDAYLSVTAPCAARGFAPELIGFIGNAVGALAVKILGNKQSVEPVSLFKYVTTLLK